MKFDEKLYEELIEREKLEIKHLKFFHLCLKYDICPNCHSQLNITGSDTAGCVGFKCYDCGFDLKRYRPPKLSLN